MHVSTSRNLTCLLVVMAAFFSRTYAQKITNVDFEVVESTVRIHYDIAGCSGDENYDVKLLLGRNGRLTQIDNGLSGDLKRVPCGSSNTIIWDVLSDRDELKGRIYFVVEIQGTHEVLGPRKTDGGKRWSRRSWKADKGYAGGSIGVFGSYESYLVAPYGLEQNGFFLNATIGYLPSLLLGICSTVYIYGAPKNNEFELASWANYGIMLGPLISLPIGNKIKWEIRPQVGYSVISTSSDLQDPDSVSYATSGVAYNIGTGLRLNLGKRTCYMLNLEYLSSPQKLDDYYHRPVQPDRGKIGASVGVGFRFY